MSAPTFRYATCLTVTGEADPQLPARLLGLITVQNRLPLIFECKLAADDTCRIHMLVEGGDDAFVRRIATQARKIPTVIEAWGALHAHSARPSKPAAARHSAASNIRPS